MVTLNQARIASVLRSFCEQFPGACLVLEDNKGALVQAVRYDQEQGFSDAEQLSLVTFALRSQPEARSGRIICRDENCGTLYLTDGADTPTGRVCLFVIAGVAFLNSACRDCDQGVRATTEVPRGDRGSGVRWVATH